MSLNETQKAEVARWLEQGLKLSEIQKRIETDFDLHPTYMEVKLLISELNVLPKDPATTPAPKSQLTQPQAPAAPDKAAPKPGGISVTVDQIARPGAVASGSVTFSDGQSATWYLDEAMRLGLMSKQPGYKPPAADMQEFQVALQRELARAGF